MINFNVNHNVYVKLTDVGRLELIKQHTHLTDAPYIPPVEDDDGWSKWQLWCLMSQLGGKCSNGFNPPFEPEIRIDV